MSNSSSLPPPPPPPPPPPRKQRHLPPTPQRREAGPGLLVPVTAPQATEISSTAAASECTPKPQLSGPTWYFFYGTLTKPSILSRILDLDTDPVLRPAKIFGWSLSIWGQYKTLISGPAENRIDGFAYLVETKEDEARLARYETGAYKAHRCMIYFTDDDRQEGLEMSKVQGMTFVYAEDEEALKEARFDRRLWQRQMGVALPDVWFKQK